jgi:hypothetical protein
MPDDPPIPESSKQPASVPWDAARTPTPVGDIRALAESARSYSSPALFPGLPVVGLVRKVVTDPQRTPVVTIELDSVADARHVEAALLNRRCLLGPECDINVSDS